MQDWCMWIRNALIHILWCDKGQLHSEVMEILLFWVSLLFYL